MRKQVVKDMLLVMGFALFGVAAMVPPPGETVWKKAYCSDNGYCVQDDFYDCVDTDQDGWCDESRRRPLPGPW